MANVFDWKAKHGRKKIAAAHDGAMHHGRMGTHHTGKAPGQGTKLAGGEAALFSRAEIVDHDGTGHYAAKGSMESAKMGTQHSGKLPDITGRRQAAGSPATRKGKGQK